MFRINCAKMKEIGPGRGASLALPLDTNGILQCAEMFQKLYEMEKILLTIPFPFPNLPMYSAGDRTRGVVSRYRSTDCIQ